MPPAELLKYLNLLVYGEPGAGKTYLGGSAQDHKDTSPLLIIDIEGGTTTLRHRQDIDVISARSVQEVKDAHNKLRMSIDPKTGTMIYKTVMLDSVTELQKLDMAEIMRLLHDSRPDLDPDIPSPREWGKSGIHMREIVRGFRDLPCNTIITALVSEEKDDSNVITKYPSLPGKLRVEVPGFFDIVSYLYTVSENEEMIRKMQFTGTRRVIAKDRTSCLGDFVESPTIPKLWELIQAGEAKANN